MKTHLAHPSSQHCSQQANKYYRHGCIICEEFYHVHGLFRDCAKSLTSLEKKICCKGQSTACQYFPYFLLGFLTPPPFTTVLFIENVDNYGQPLTSIFLTMLNCWKCPLTTVYCNPWLFQCTYQKR